MRSAFITAMAMLALVPASPSWAHPPPPPSSPPSPPVFYPPPPPHPGHEEQNAARRARREGNVESLRQIEQRVLPTMPGMQYLGPDYNAQTMVYRLRFIHDGRVVFVDVDGRTGQVLGRSQ